MTNVQSLLMDKFVCSPCHKICPDNFYLFRLEERKQVRNSLCKGKKFGDSFLILETCAKQKENKQTKKNERKKKNFL